MPTYISIAQIIIAAALILAVLAQTKGGGLGGIFGQPDSVYRTRRGAEKVLVQLTVALVVVFVVLSIVAIRLVK